MKKIFLGVVLLVSIFMIPKASAFVYPNGTLLKADNDVKIYAVWNGKQRWIRSGDVFNLYNFKWADIKTISSLALKNLPVNNLVRVEGDAKVYALNDLGYKRHIQNPAIFNSYGLDWSDVATITQKELDNYPETNLIRMDGDPKVYYLENGVKKWITTAEVFYINNLNWDAIQVVNKEDLDTYTGGANIEGVVVPMQPAASTQAPATTPVNTTPPTQNTETPTQRYITTEGGAVYDTVLKKFISPATSTSTPSSPTPTTTQSSTVVVGSISLSASPSTIPADGKSTSVITATVKDTGNNATPNQTVYFSYGNVTVAAVTDANGTANIAYTADANTGTVTITASIGSIKSTIQISQIAQASILLVPQLKVTISSDKSQLGANGQDTATLTVKVTNTDGTPAGNKTVLEVYPKNQMLTTDANGIATFTVASTQVGTLFVDVTVDGQNYRTSINVISTTGTVSGYINFSGDVRTSPSGAVRAPASDQILAFFVASGFDSSISGLKIKSIKLKLVNLDQTWFQNVRITNSPPCTQGRFCSIQTIAGPASYNLESDGILTITPNTPVDLYQGNPGAIYIIADMLNPTTIREGTNYPLVTYQISLPDNSSIELTGKVNGYDINTIRLNLMTEYNQNGLTPVTATVNSNYCVTSSGQTVSCY